MEEERKGRDIKAGKGGQDLEGGGGKRSMIATWKVQEEEPHGVHTEGKAAKTQEAIA